MSNEKKTDTSNVNAENNSITIGSIAIGGNVQGNVTIGNTTIYQYDSEEDIPLTSEEIEYGLSKLTEYLPERAPILQNRFNSEAKKLRATLGMDIKALSPMLKTQHEDGVNHMKMMCLEVLDISFLALCKKQTPPPYDSRPPFLGLLAFRPEDKDFFFGRETLIEKLVKQIRLYPFLAIVGSSGSGKSSLVMAGLIPALEAQMAYFTPSSSPLNQLHVAKENSNQGSIFVVDQFEELFTLATNETERDEFIHELLELSKTQRVIITMRADFWGEVATYKELKQVMQEHQELIAPMDAEELHSAVAKQAEAVGLRFSADLSESILEEVKGEPGAMPLLQHALWMLWKRRHGLWLKAEEYRAFGGIQRAIATTADEFYEKFSLEDRERMRHVFIRLTRLDEKGKASRDTRRRVQINDLTYKNDTLEQTSEFVRQLANSRLLTTSSESLNGQEVEVAHEALIRNWSRLRTWLDEDRLSLLVQEEIREAASAWEASNHDNDAIAHRGGKLEDALHMAGNPRTAMTAIETHYLEACKNIAMGLVKRLEAIVVRFGLPTLIIITGLVLESLAAHFALSLFIGITIPAYMIYLLYKLDNYRIVEAKWMLFCLMGGVMTYQIAAQINPALVKFEVTSWDMVIRIYAPIIETCLKGLVLYLLLGRIKLARTVDGMIYGAAIATGFAIIENYEYIVGHSETAVTIALSRVFSTNLIHMAGSGLLGYLLIAARFDKSRFFGATKFFAALILPAFLNSTFNTMVNNGVNLVVAIGFGIIPFIALIACIRYFINLDLKWIEKYLLSNFTTNTKSTLVNNTQQVTNIIKNLFGKVRASQIEKFLVLQAQREFLQKALQNADETKSRQAIENQLSTVRKKIRGSRGAISNYCWENIKALMPELAKLTEEN